MIKVNDNVLLYVAGTAYIYNILGQLYWIWQLSIVMNVALKTTLFSIQALDKKKKPLF